MLSLSPVSYTHLDVYKRQIVVIMLAGRLFFKEKLTRWRVTGISLITLGVAIVGVGG